MSFYAPQLEFQKKSHFTRKRSILPYKFPIILDSSADLKDLKWLHESKNSTLFFQKQSEGAIKLFFAVMREF